MAHPVCQLHRQTCVPSRLLCANNMRNGLHARHLATYASMHACVCVCVAAYRKAANAAANNGRERKDLYTGKLGLTQNTRFAMAEQQGFL